VCCLPAEVAESHRWCWVQAGGESSLAGVQLAAFPKADAWLTAVGVLSGGQASRVYM
jgi:hypothetical protein